MAKYTREKIKEDVHDSSSLLYFILHDMEVYNRWLKGKETWGALISEIQSYNIPVQEFLKFLYLSPNGPERFWNTSNSVFKGAKIPTTIPEHGFEGDDEITEFKVHADMNIEAYAFSGCTSLKEFQYVGDSAAKIEISRYAFSGCTSLEEIVIPSNVNRIKTGAFNGCTNLKRVYFTVQPNEELDCAFHAFDGCVSLSEKKCGIFVHAVGAEKRDINFFKDKLDRFGLLSATTNAGANLYIRGIAGAENDYRKLKLETVQTDVKGVKDKRSVSSITKKDMMVTLLPTIKDSRYECGRQLIGFSRSSVPYWGKLAKVVGDELQIEAIDRYGASHFIEYYQECSVRPVIRIVNKANFKVEELKNDRGIDTIQLFGERWIVLDRDSQQVFLIHDGDIGVSRFCSDDVAEEIKAYVRAQGKPSQILPTVLKKCEAYKVSENWFNNLPDSNEEGM